MSTFHNPTSFKMFFSNQGQGSILKPGNVTLNPLPVNSSVDPNLAADGNLDTYVTLTPGSILTFTLDAYGERMEATNVQLTLLVNASGESRRTVLMVIVIITMSLKTRECKLCL